MAELRSVEARKADVLAALERQGDLWLATAGAGGRAHLIAVSAWWDGRDVVVATRTGTRTAENLRAHPDAKLAGGSPADVVMIDARLVETVAASEAGQVAEGFAKAVGWDPREAGKNWLFYRLRPARIQAYRGYDELEGRDVMRDSAWLA